MKDHFCVQFRVFESPLIDIHHFKLTFQYLCALNFAFIFLYGNTTKQVMQLDLFEKYYENSFNMANKLIKYKYYKIKT